MAPPCTWLVHMTCRLHGSQNSKKSRRNSLFPDASPMIFSRNRAPVASPPYSVPMHTANCRAHALEVRQLWLNLQREIIFASTFTATIVGFAIFCRVGTAQPSRHKIELLLSSANASDIFSFFVVGANTKPLGASA